MPQAPVREYQLKQLTANGNNNQSYMSVHEAQDKSQKTCNLTTEKEKLFNCMRVM